jgi:hypothetical protein
VRCTHPQKCVCKNIENQQKNAELYINGMWYGIFSPQKLCLNCLPILT